MENKQHNMIKAYYQKYRKRQFWKKLVSVLGCLVVFCTTYALILPAITMDQGTICGMTEHQHTSDCYLMPESGHVHTDACYTETTTYICGMEEAEDDGGFFEMLFGDESSTSSAVEYEPAEPAHTHSDACMEISSELTCGLEEAVPHSHEDTCFDENGELICELPTELEEPLLICDIAPHVHSDGCFPSEEEEETEDNGSVENDELEEIPDSICGMEEHSHMEACYDADGSLICVLEEHQHDTGCYPLVEEETSEMDSADTGSICGMEAHQHGEACYDADGGLICVLEEHQHSENCYADRNADVETASEWENTFADIELTGIWADDLIAIAESQLGYRESSRNVIVLEDGSKKGYTRYGDWYGDPYGDWCAMFISFCLYYADIPDDIVPYEANCIRWIEQLEEQELYQPADGYTPKKGDIIFFDVDLNGEANHVGIVTGVDSQTGMIQTLEGNNWPVVAEFEYMADDAQILGYGVLPDIENGLCRQTLQAVVYTNATYKQKADDETRITISGLLPLHGEARAYPVELEQELINGQSVVLAYDITIFDEDGHPFEPDEDAEMLCVSIQPAAWQEPEKLSNPEEEAVITALHEAEEGAVPEAAELEYSVYYIPDKGEPEAMDSSSDETAVNFYTDHFST
ncbi:MAG: CHAP domain-containing protein, partial [Peptococcaceae bacterium]|nr:CHAP domain-containing protein [Peptococcaceae bacterium]